MFAKQIYLGLVLALFVVGTIANILLFKRRRGIDPLALRTTTSRVERYIGLVFLETIVLYMGCGIVFVVNPRWADCLHTFRRLDHGPVNLLGFLLCLAAMLAISLALKTMGSSWRIGIDENVPTSLVTDGIFQYSRNPIFAGLLVLSAGLFLILPNFLTLLLAAVSYFTINVQVRLEEDFLEKTHGDAYRNYLAQVGRFFPRVGPGRRVGPRGTA